jgi:hypothetical protein
MCKVITESRIEEFLDEPVQPHSLNRSPYAHITAVNAKADDSSICIAALSVPKAVLIILG